MERKIGEIFEYNGEWYQCVEGNFCKSCDFYQPNVPALERSKNCKNFCCFGTIRKDKTRVIFKKLEKLGEPYIIGNKLIQRYKIYPTTYHINVYGWYYHNLDVKSWTIDIEIKQTKEDMEENDIILSNSENIGKILKEFNLEAAKSGKPVCTRDGRKARIICFDLKNEEYPIVAAIENDSFEILLTYTINGEIVKGNYKSDSDLMMLPEKKEGWVNVYKRKNEYICENECNVSTGIALYKSEGEAKRNIDKNKIYVNTIKINWEE